MDLHMEWVALRMDNQLVHSLGDRPVLFMVWPAAGSPTAQTVFGFRNRDFSKSSKGVCLGLEVDKRNDQVCEGIDVWAEYYESVGLVK